MTTKEERFTPEHVQSVAHLAITGYVNSLNCDTVDEVKAALSVLQWMAGQALDLVTNGKSEKLS